MPEYEDFNPRTAIFEEQLRYAAYLGELSRIQVETDSNHGTGPTAPTDDLQEICDAAFIGDLRPPESPHEAFIDAQRTGTAVAAGGPTNISMSVLHTFTEENLRRVSLPNDWPIARPQFAPYLERVHRAELRQAYTWWCHRELALAGSVLLPGCTWCGRTTGNFCDACDEKGIRPCKAVCNQCGECYTSFGRELCRQCAIHQYVHTGTNE